VSENVPQSIQELKTPSQHRYALSTLLLLKIYLTLELTCLRY